MNSPSAPPKLRVGAILFGMAQLALGGWAASWAWGLWRRSESDPPPALWWAAALAIFCLALAQINLVGPLLARLGGRGGPPRQLPYRLAPDTGHPARFAWSMLSLALAFGGPLLPLAMLLAQVAGERDYDWTIPAVGFTLVGLILGCITGFLGLRSLYQLALGGQTLVEASAERLLPGETLNLYLHYEPGRLPAASIAARLACWRTTSETSASGKSTTIKTEVAYEQELLPSMALLPGQSWASALSAVIPLGAMPSYSGRTTTRWGVEIQLAYAGLPDLAETFAFTVDALPATEEDWEEEEEPAA